MIPPTSEASSTYPDSIFSCKVLFFSLFPFRVIVFHNLLCAQVTDYGPERRSKF
ncbi:hypothetical protein M134_3929 [Bacteroides fragilis str. S24L34]|nr:hypothetical protein M134_3929 [Bacteroides fragilis str. S24L34]